MEQIKEECALIHNTLTNILNRTLDKHRYAAGMEVVREHYMTVFKQFINLEEKIHKEIMYLELSKRETSAKLRRLQVDLKILHNLIVNN
jgi:hypothetical protein